MPPGSVEQWADEHKPGSRGAHDYDLADYGLTPEGVRERFADISPPTMRPPDQPSSGRRTRRRDKLSPDPAVRRAILAAASTTLREQGVRGLSIAAVLERASLSTRAFYRHFESKDELVAAVFLEMRARREAAAATQNGHCRNPDRGGSGWIDGDSTWRSTTTSVRSAPPVAGGPIADVRLARLVQPAYAEMLKPLSRSTERGLQRGRVPRYRSGDRRPVHPWRGVGGHRPAMGDRRSRPRRSSASGSCVSACAGWA